MFENLTLFQVIIVGTLMFFALTAIIIAVISMYNKKLVTEKLAHKDALVKSEIVGLEKERERLAKDLHDEVGANLSFIAMSLSSQLKKVECAEAKASFEELLHELKQTVSRVREISHDLVPPLIEKQGLVAALRDLGSIINQSTFEFNLTSTSELKQLNPTVAINLYRVLKELINNSVKHSGGNSINITLEETATQLNITYADNGQGFDYEKGMAKSSQGLKTIENRINFIGATYSMEVQAGKVTAYHIWLPNRNT
jgi:Signal transduction histidine kinase